MWAQRACCRAASVSLSLSTQNSNTCVGSQMSAAHPQQLAEMLAEQLDIDDKVVVCKGSPPVPLVSLEHIGATETIRLLPHGDFNFEQWKSVDLRNQVRLSPPSQRRSDRRGKHTRGHSACCQRYASATRLASVVGRGIGFALPRPPRRARSRPHNPCFSCPPLVASRRVSSHRAGEEEGEAQAQAQAVFVPRGCHGPGAHDIHLFQ